MQLDRPKAPRQIVRDLPPHIALVLETIEGAGFRVVGNPQEFGKYIGIDFRPPLALQDVMTTDNPEYQQIIDHQSTLARQALRGVGFDVQVRSFGWVLSIWLPTSGKPGRKGRPPESDEILKRIDTLRGQGLTFPEIAARMKERKTPDAWRKLLTSRRSAPRNERK